MVITQTGYDSNGKLIKIIKSVRDDFDFTYGYETDRSDGSVAGDPYSKKVYGSMKDEPYRDPTTGRPKVGAMDHATSTGSEVGAGKYEGLATIGRTIVWADRIAEKFLTGSRGGNPVPLNIDLTKHYRGNTLPLGDMQQYANESRTYSKIKKLLRERNKA